MAKLTFDGINSIGAANKYIHGISVTGLIANTECEYKVGEGLDSSKGTFRQPQLKVVKIVLSLFILLIQRWQMQQMQKQ